jgi:spermidine synthase
LPPPSEAEGRVGAARRPSAGPLLAIVLVIATAGLVYELSMAAVASYVLGDSVTQFSIVIGIYLSALGIGAYVSRFVEQRLELVFVDVELATALVGGLSTPGLFLAFGFTNAFGLILYSTVLAVGVLVGLELPLLMRILEQRLAFKELVARALTFDYAGALVGSLAFSLLLVPVLGLVHASLVCGLLNALVGLASTWLLAGTDPARRRAMAGARVRALIVLLVLIVTALEAGRVSDSSETALLGARIELSVQSRYQHIVLAERGGHHQLFLNGNLQFSSDDEHRYHEALVHPVLAAAARRRHVLIGGGGDGLAAREVLRWPDVASVTVVDLDERMTDLARTHPVLVRLNRGAFSDPRVRVVTADAMLWFGQSRDEFDVILLDFPDPSNFSLGKLYSERFYRRARARLAAGGALGVQSTSPFFARRAFWCVVETLRAAGFVTRPYHAFVPSFGEWGFVLAKRERFEQPPSLPALSLRFLTNDALPGLFDFPPDMAEVAVRTNRLNNQALVAYYVSEWRRFE